MTLAVCFKCGEFKFGSYTECESCGQKPKTEEELAASMAMTDHFFKPEALGQMAKRLKAGEPVTLGNLDFDAIVKEIRESGTIRFLQNADAMKSKEAANHLPHDHENGQPT